MDFDRKLFNNFKPEKSLPVFRLYGWNPPSVSLGRFQEDTVFVDKEYCREQGIDIVRRITGGGAIFHYDDIAYSIVCHSEIFGAVSVKETYRKITGFIIEAYRKLGIKACFKADCSDTADSAVNTPVCYEGIEEYDILIDGKKIGGNAQKRAKKVIFQHGSIPFSVNKETESRIFKNFCVNRAGLKDLGISREMFKKVFIRSFIENFNAEFEEYEPAFN